MYRMGGWGQDPDRATFQMQSFTFTLPKVNTNGLHFKTLQHSFKRWPNSVSALWPCLAKVGLIKENSEVPLRSDISISVQRRREVQASATWGLWWHALYHSFFSWKIPRLMNYDDKWKEMVERGRCSHFSQVASGGVLFWKTGHP